MMSNDGAVKLWNEALDKERLRLSALHPSKTRDEISRMAAGLLAAKYPAAHAEYLRAYNAGR